MRQRAGARRAARDWGRTDEYGLTVVRAEDSSVVASDGGLRGAAQAGMLRADENDAAHDNTVRGQFPPDDAISAAAATAASWWWCRPDWPLLAQFQFRRARQQHQASSYV